MRTTAWTPPQFSADTRCVAKTIFFIGMILAASGLVSPPVALVGGILYGFSLRSSVSPRGETTIQSSSSGVRRWPRIWDESSAGFSSWQDGIPLYGREHYIRHAARLGVGKILTVTKGTSFLISAGTAICGGSAIAAIAPITDASEEEIAVSLGTVFLLNSVALLTFPAIGTALHLTQTQFGLWSALAIHDTSSVVGATAKFGAVALAVGTTVKLARALWIVPLSIGTAMVRRASRAFNGRGSSSSFALPQWQILTCHHSKCCYPMMKHLGVIGLTVTLYLIGTGLSKKTLQEVGIRPLLQGILLWMIVAGGSLALIRGGWIHL